MRNQAQAQDECKSLGGQYVSVGKQHRDNKGVIHDTQCRDVTTGLVVPVSLQPNAILANAYPTLQAAVTAGNGGFVYVPAGTYTGALTIPSGTTLYCYSRASIITIANASNVSVITLAAGALNVSIINCTIDGNGTNQTAVTSYGIQAVAPNRLTIINGEIRNTRGAAFRCDAATDGSTSSSDVHIQGEYIHDIGGNGINVLEKIDGLEIISNHIQNWGTVIAASDAVALSATSNNRISYVRIAHNRLIAQSSTLFAIEGVRNIVGLSISDNQISGNYIGISLQASDVTIHGNSQTGSTIGGQRSGMELCLIRGVIEGNTISNGQIVITAATAYGLQSSHILVTSNHVTSTIDNTPALATGGSGSTATDLILSNNDLFIAAPTTPSAAIYLGSYGSVGKFNRVQVTGNKLLNLSGNGGQGIRVNTVAGSSDLLVQNNFATGFTQGWYDPADSNTTEVTISGNDFRGNITPISHNGTGTGWRIWGNITAIGQVDFRIGTAVGMTVGSGAPVSGACTANNLGSIYFNILGGTSTSLYVCTAAGTWTAK